jgi:hypothetical protein
MLLPVVINDGWYFPFDKFNTNANIIGLSSYWWLKLAKGVKGSRKRTTDLTLVKDALGTPDSAIDIPARCRFFPSEYRFLDFKSSISSSHVFTIIM